MNIRGIRECHGCSGDKAVDALQVMRKDIMVLNQLRSAFHSAEARSIPIAETGNRSV